MIVVFKARASDRSQNESGSVLLLTALSLTMLLTLAAFSLNASLAYDRRNQYSAAADAAAKTGAFEVLRDSAISDANLAAFANHELGRMGIGITLTGGVGAGPKIHRCTTAGATCTAPYNTSGYVEAVVSQSMNTLMSLLSASSVTPTARAVAGTANPVNCLITMQDLSLGHDTITLNNCGAEVGGNLNGTQTNAVITGTPMPDVSVTGTCIGTCGAMGNLATGQLPPTNPLNGLAAPNVPGACIVAATDPLPGGCYTSIPASIHTLQSGGTFKVTGLMMIDTTLTGTNVLLYLTSTGVIKGNTGTLSLTAGNTAPYAGIAIFGDTGSDIDLKNNFNFSINGAVYMPGSNIDFKNSVNIPQTGCTLFISNSLSFKNGGGQFLNSTGCAASFGNASFLNVAMAE
jgi:hypothetical protein